MNAHRSTSKAKSAVMQRKYRPKQFLDRKKEWKKKGPPCSGPCLSAVCLVFPGICVETSAG